MVEWLLAPLSGDAYPATEPWVYWHARLMVLSWSFLLPLGMLAARYFKVTPKQDWPRVLDNKLWWRTHLWCQSAGVAAMTLGLILIFGRGWRTGPAVTAHHVCGWIVVSIGWIQVASAVLRGDKGGPTEPTLRGDHYDMTPRRLAFEAVHKHLGWIAVPLALTATALGLGFVDAPRWMLLFLAIWWISLIASAVHLQASGRCVDTYQAIWGPDPKHPCNRRQPIGWGVSRRKRIAAD